MMIHRNLKDSDMVDGTELFYDNMYSRIFIDPSMKFETSQNTIVFFITRLFIVID